MTDLTPCGAKKRNGDLCGGAPMKGQRLCARHGGKSPQAKKAAERRLAEQEAQKNMEKAVRTLGITDKAEHSSETHISPLAVEPRL